MTKAKLKKVLGLEVVDKVTGFTGIATARCEYLYGETRIEVTDTDLKEVWFAESRLEYAAKYKEKEVELPNDVNEEGRV